MGQLIKAGTRGGRLIKFALLENNTAESLLKRVVTVCLNLAATPVRDDLY